MAVLWVSGCASQGPKSGPGAQPSGARPDGSGITITLRAETDKLAGRQWTAADLEAARVVVEKRARGTTVRVSRVEAVPSDKIVLYARGMLSPAEIARVTTPHTLRFYLIPQLEPGSGAATPKWSLARDRSSHETFRDSNSGATITDVEIDRAVFARPPELAAQDFLPNFKIDITQQGSPLIAFELSAESAARFATIATKHAHEHLAIFIDHKLITVPILQGPIPAKGIIEGDFTLAQARNTAETLNSGALPVPLVVVPDTAHK